MYSVEFMTKPDISVIIPLYNKEAIIERTVQSVLNQAYSNFELIIVNDGSTDNSLEVVKNIQDERIVLLEQSNGGPSKARNTGAKAAKADWIIFLDADDELTADALAHFVTLKNNHNGIEIYCCEFVVNQLGRQRQDFIYQNRIINNGYKAWLFKKCMPRTGATMYSKNLVLKCPFNEKIRRFEDLECIFRMFPNLQILLSNHVVLTVNIDYAAASTARRSIKEDFLGHLDFSGKSFWEYMALYKFYLGEREYYPKEVKQLYPNLHRRYDLLILCKIILLLKKLHVFA